MLNNDKGAKIDIIRFEQGNKAKVSDLVARENSLAIFVNQKKLTTLNCSPGSKKFLGIGFIKTAGILLHKEDIASIKIEEKSINIEIKRALFPFKEIDNINTMVEIQKQAKKQTKMIPLAPLSSKISYHTIYSLISNMEKKAVFFKLSGGVHSCALAGFDGSFLLFCEDISRYNTIDRVFGEALLKDIATDNKIMLTSCRITSGIINKIITGNIPIVISRSAPTDLAVKMAKQKGMTLIGFARGKRMNIYTHPERIED